MILYHGSSIEVKKPNFKHGRTNIDFGLGFYLTEDKKMAEKWSAGKASSILNTYELNIEGLNIVHLGLTKQWLDFVSYNRGFSDDAFNIEGIDIITGPTADDKMFDTLSAYFSGAITSEQAIEYLNIAGFSNQIVLKSEKALQQLTFIRSKEIKGQQKDMLLNQISYERKNASRLLKEIIEKDKNQHKKESRLQDDYEGR